MHSHLFYIKAGDQDKLFGKSFSSQRWHLWCHVWCHLWGESTTSNLRMPSVIRGMVTVSYFSALCPSCDTFFYFFFNSQVFATDTWASYTCTCCGTKFTSKVLPFFVLLQFLITVAASNTYSACWRQVAEPFTFSFLCIFALWVVKLTHLNKQPLVCVWLFLH